MSLFHFDYQLTLINLTLESAAEMWYLCKSWTIKPAKRLNVLRWSAWSPLPGKNAIYLGILVAGLISIRTLLAVLMKTWRKLNDLPLHRQQLTWRSPALLRGESKSISKDWWVISGRALEKSRPFLQRINLIISKDQTFLTWLKIEISPGEKATVLVDVEQGEVLAGLAGLEVRPLQHDDQPLLLLLGNLNKRHISILDKLQEEDMTYYAPLARRPLWQPLPPLLQPCAFFPSHESWLWGNWSFELVQ